MSSALLEPARVEEPQAGPDYAAVFSRVAAEGRVVIVRRDGADLAAVIPLEQLQVLQDLLTQQQAERRARQVDWTRLPEGARPPQSWFDEMANPCEPESTNS